jgi:16S rRNA G527 N7-methylase RsmG
MQVDVITMRAVGYVPFVLEITEPSLHPTSDTDLGPSS